MFFETACLITVTAPLTSAILVGFFGKKVGKNFTNFLAIGRRYKYAPQFLSCLRTSF